ncbi:MAG: hypothetical protein QNK05_14870 [Myxococcota bacterium]|nr:hypothetical protein [Myxococcota bacterium]
MSRTKSVLRRQMRRSEIDVATLAASMNRPASVIEGVLAGRSVQRSTAQKLLAALEKSAGMNANALSVEDFFEPHREKVRVVTKTAPPPPKEPEPEAAEAEASEGEGGEE